MFLLKKIIAPFLFPLPLCLTLLLAGLALLWFTRRQKAGKVLVTAGALLLSLLSYGFFSERLLAPLERQYAPLVSPEMAGQKPSWVVVLGGGSSSDAQLPPAARLSEASLARLVEGVRLQRQLPGSRLILSGGSVFGYGADTETMHALALELGVGPEAVVLDPVSLDTETQARQIREVVGAESFLLVTSASHMPRSVALFQKAGMNPTPAPTHFVAQRNQGVVPGDFFPSSGGLRKSETAVYEHLGRLWAKLRGKA